MDHIEHYSALLVDDENDVRLLWRLLLEQEGRFFPISEALDGEDAFPQIEDSCFDLVLTNFSMPTVSGFDVIEECRRQCADTLIVMSSTVDVSQDEVTRLGGDLFFPKAEATEDMMPLILDRLADSVRHVAREQS